MYNQCFFRHYVVPKMEKIGTTPIRIKVLSGQKRHYADPKWKKALCRLVEGEIRNYFAVKTRFSKVKITKHAPMSENFRLRRCKVIVNIEAGRHKAF